MALSDYLAKNYLSADKPSKKRKRKHVGESGLVIADDKKDFTESSKQKSHNPGGGDEDGPTIVPDARTARTKGASWKTVGAAAPTNAEQEAADAILASIEEERKSRVRADEEAVGPTVVAPRGLSADEGPAQEDAARAAMPKMASGALAGLQTAAQVSAAVKEKERLEREKMIAEGLVGGGGGGGGEGSAAAGAAGGGRATETIYRDASGRIINVAMKRASLRREAEEAAVRKRNEDEARAGDVQRRGKEARRRQLDSVRTQGVARYADDEQLNRELRARDRWDDPMASMVGVAAGGGEGKGGGGKGRRRVYAGASEPNRYGIKPGYRWDGVDRSNGFERKWFAARNKVQSRKDLEYAWEMDE